MITILTVSLLSYVAYIIHLSISKEKRTTSQLVKLFLLYQIVFNLGIMGFIAFCGLVFFPELSAHTMGWPICPFEHELGNVNLAFCVLGFLCIWKRGDFWLATIIGASIWLIGDAIGHVILKIMSPDLTKAHIAFLLWSDLVTPLLLIALYLIGEHLERKEAAESRFS